MCVKFPKIYFLNQPILIPFCILIALEMQKKPIPIHASRFKKATGGGQ